MRDPQSAGHLAVKRQPREYRKPRWLYLQWWSNYKQVRFSFDATERNNFVFVILSSFIRLTADKFFGGSLFFAVKINDSFHETISVSSEAKDKFI